MGGSDPAEEELVGARWVKREMGSRFPVRMGMRPVSVVFYSISRRVRKEYLLRGHDET